MYKELFVSEIENNLNLIYLQSRKEDRVWKLWRAAAREEPVQQRARRHQARTNEVQSSPTTSRVQVLNIVDKLSKSIYQTILVRLRLKKKENI